MSRVHSSSTLICLQAVTLHTSLGDLKLEVFCDQVCHSMLYHHESSVAASLLLMTSTFLQAPRAAENFLALCASGFYNDTLFHRNIKVQRGSCLTATGHCPAQHHGKHLSHKLPGITRLKTVQSCALYIDCAPSCRAVQHGLSP